ncbi:MAG: triose-phosphate isomerase [Crocinitomicaceae bacterium]|nr:triose-phosphate isomerase [Crocinitomicaceae bacterium]|tara:strand:- start:455 stop:1210 length:756 start_codon:yes stop_codon:yes gene_type:complete
MAQKIVLGNWKMNLNLFQAEELLNDVDRLKKEVPKDVQIGVATPSIYLHSALNILTEGKVWVGSQNIYHEPNGAYTGEVSADMVNSLACHFTLIGHSERRQYFNENNEQLKAKVNLALENDLIPVFCCGESLEQRKSGDYLEVIKSQLEESLLHLDKGSVKGVVIAYEPIWAIGTGETASADQAQEVHQFIRSLLTQKYDAEVANLISILYGGSCNPTNASELFQQNDIDGGLIGGASLKATNFIEIAKSF